MINKKIKIIVELKILANCKRKVAGTSLNLYAIPGMLSVIGSNVEFRGHVNKSANPKKVCKQLFSKEKI